MNQTSIINNCVTFYSDMLPCTSTGEIYKDLNYFYKLIIYFYIKFNLNKNKTFNFTVNQIYKDCFSYKSKQRICELLRKVIPELFTECRINGYKFNIDFSCDISLINIKNNTKITVNEISSVDCSAPWVQISENEFYQVFKKIENDAPRPERLLALYLFIKYAINVNSFFYNSNYQLLFTQYPYRNIASISTNTIETYVHIDKNAVIQYTSALKDKGLICYFWLGTYFIDGKLRQMSTIYSLNNNYEDILNYVTYLQDKFNIERFSRMDILLHKIKQSKGTN